MKINDDYVAGILERSGGFYIGRSRYLMFKLTAQNKTLFDEVFEYMKSNHDIDFITHKNIYQVINRKSILNLIQFMTNNTTRKDFEKHLNNENVRIGPLVKKRKCDKCGKIIIPVKVPKDITVLCKECRDNGKISKNRKIQIQENVSRVS